MKLEKKIKVGMTQRQLGFFINRLTNQGGMIYSIKSKGPEDDIKWTVEYSD